MCLLCDSTEEEQKNFGKIFGYPECCINEFVKAFKSLNEGGKDDFDRNQLIVAERTDGFVPCKKHAKEIIDKKLNPKSIYIKRDEMTSLQLNLLADAFERKQYSSN